MADAVGKKGKAEMKTTMVRTMISGALACASLMCAAEAKKPSAPNAELRRFLDRYGMKYGECDRGEDGSGVAVRWVAYRPSATSQKLPVLVFLPGLGELGPDPVRLFGNRGIFDLATSRDFQKRHPCVFVALQTDAGVERHCLLAGRTTPSLAALNAALEEALAGLGKVRIDRERIYLTGLSAGGGACCSLICAYPGRFAAAIPVSGVVHPRLLSPAVPENIWMMYNSGEYNRIKRHVDFDAVSREMAGRGGDFRVGELTGEGHNAWDAAWRETALWDWMFTKRAARPSTGAPAKRRTTGVKQVAASGGREWKCTASAAAESDSTLPRFGADGLAGTAYRSAAAAKKGDWWQVEMPSPPTGTVHVRTGDAKGRCTIARGSAMVSPDGRRWLKAAAISRGEAVFRIGGSLRFVRLEVDADQDEPFAVREVVLK